MTLATLLLIANRCADALPDRALWRAKRLPDQERRHRRHSRGADAAGAPGDAAAAPDRMVARRLADPAGVAGTLRFVYNAKSDIYGTAPWWQGSGVTLVTPDGKTELASENGISGAPC